MKGELWKTLSFEVERELSGAGPWKDVFVNYRASRGLQVQAGRFKVPFSLDRLTGSADLHFIDRSLAADRLSPGRAPGVMAHGRVGLVSYEAGVFRREHRASELAPQGFAPSIAGRAVMQPFRGSKTVLDSIQVGAAYMSTPLPVGIAEVSGRAFSGLTFFPDGIWIHGAEHRLGLESRWRPGPLAFSAEYVRVTNERRGQSVDDGDLPSLVSQGWYASAAWVITGDRDPNTPSRPLGRDGLGALSLAARLEGLSFGSAATAFAPSTSPRADTVLSRSDLAFTTGLNWYPQRWVKVQANIIRESFRNLDERRTPQWSHVLALHFSL